MEVGHAVMLSFACPVAQLAQTVEVKGTLQDMMCLAIVQPDLVLRDSGSMIQLTNDYGSFDATGFAQGRRQLISARKRGQFSRELAASDRRVQARTIMNVSARFCYGCRTVTPDTSALPSIITTAPVQCRPCREDKMVLAASDPKM